MASVRKVLYSHLCCRSSGRSVSNFTPCSPCPEQSCIAGAEQLRGSGCGSASPNLQLLGGFTSPLVCLATSKNSPAWKEGETNQGLVISAWHYLFFSALDSPCLVLEFRRTHHSQWELSLFLLFFLFLTFSFAANVKCKWNKKCDTEIL